MFAIHFRYNESKIRKAYFRMAQKYHPDKNPEGRVSFILNLCQMKQMCENLFVSFYYLLLSQKCETYLVLSCSEMLGLNVHC